MNMAKSENNKLLTQVNKICNNEVWEEVESIMTFELKELGKMRNRVTKIDEWDILEWINEDRDLFTAKFCQDFAIVNTTKQDHKRELTQLQLNEATELEHIQSCSKVKKELSHENTLLDEHNQWEVIDRQDQIKL